MSNLIDYVEWRGDLTFKESHFNKVDALVFAQIAYVIWEGLIPEDFSNPVTLNQAAGEFRKLPDYESRIDLGFLINDKTTDLMFKCADSQRFKDVKVCGLTSIFNEETIEQFAAITFFIDNYVLIAYRGTDDSIIGFEEDFQIAYKEQIPAQIHGLEYFSRVYKAFPSAKYIIVGHSKGGNIAVNTAVRCSDKLKKRIVNVYNFDGPGFNLDFFRTNEYEKIKSRILSFYPQLSVVGMLFHHDGNYEIIESSKTAIMQHDALSWNISGCNFVNKDKFTDECKFFTQTFNNWIDQVSMDERESFVYALFSLLKSSGFKTNSEIEKNPLQASARIIASYAVMNKTLKDKFKDMFILLMNTVKSELPIFRMFSSSSSDIIKKG